MDLGSTATNDLGWNRPRLVAMTCWAVVHCDFVNIRTTPSLLLALLSWRHAYGSYLRIILREEQKTDNIWQTNIAWTIHTPKLLKCSKLMAWTQITEFSKALIALHWLKHCWISIKDKNQAINGEIYHRILNLKKLILKPSIFFKSFNM